MSDTKRLYHKGTKDTKENFATDTATSFSLFFVTFVVKKIANTIA